MEMSTQQGIPSFNSRHNQYWWRHLLLVVLMLTNATNHSYFNSPFLIILPDLKAFNSLFELIVLIFFSCVTCFLCQSFLAPLTFFTFISYIAAAPLPPPTTTTFYIVQIVLALLSLFFSSTLTFFLLSFSFYCLHLFLLYFSYNYSFLKLLLLPILCLFPSFSLFTIFMSNTVIWNIADFFKHVSSSSSYLSRY